MNIEEIKEKDYLIRFPKEIFLPGTHVDRNGIKGKVAAIHSSGGKNGERYYFIIDSKGGMGLFPASALVIEG